MAVVKNLMVRVGADISGFATGMNKAGGATGNFKKQTEKAMKDSILSMSNLKKAMAQGGKNSAIVSLTDQIRELEAEQKALKEAGFSWGYEGFEGNEALLRDLKSQLKEYIGSLNIEPDGPKEWVAQLRELQSVQSQLGADGLESNEQTIQSINAQLDQFTAGLRASVDEAQPLGVQLTAAKNALKEMESVGFGAGDAAWDDMYQTVTRLTHAVKGYKSSLNGAGDESDQAARKTSKLGSAARTANSGLRSAASGASTLGKQSRASSSGVTTLVKSLRRIGVAAIGIKLVGAVMGEFRSIVSGYISQNEALQAQVDSLKNGLGQALAPAINMVTNALSKAMPYVVGISNAIGELITNLFGSGWTTIADGASAAAKATESAEAAQKKYNRTLAGFDEITKLSSNDSSATETSNTSTGSVQGKLPQWLADLPTQIEDAIRIGDYKGVGTALAESVNKGISEANNTDGSLGETIGKILQGGIDGASGFVENLDWSGLGTALYRNIEDLFKNLDLSSAYKLLGSATAGLTISIGSFVSEAITSIKEDFQKKLKENDGNIGKVIWDYILLGLNNMLKGVGLISFIEGFISTLNEQIPKKAQLSVNVTAKLTSWKESLKEKVINFQTKLTSWKESLKEKAISFQAKLTTFKDTIKDKFLEFKVNIKKGWTGSLAKLLGIESISSTLSLKLPKISIDWDSVIAFGKTFSYPKGFSIKWNAKGGIMDGAHIFGGYGNTLFGGGENGREAILPLDRNTWWMDKIADRVAQKVAGAQSGDANIIVQLVLDGKVITQTVVRNVNAQARATGKNPLAAYL